MKSCENIWKSIYFKCQVTRESEDSFVTFVGIFPYVPAFLRSSYKIFLSILISVISEKINGFLSNMFCVLYFLLFSKVKLLKYLNSTLDLLTSELIILSKTYCSWLLYWKSNNTLVLTSALIFLKKVKLTTCYSWQRYW